MKKKKKSSPKKKAKKKPAPKAKAKKPAIIVVPPPPKETTITWGKRNSDGGAVLKGIGNSTGCEYLIFLARNKTWAVKRNALGDNKPMTVRGLKTLIEAQLRASLWEKKGVEGETIPKPAPEPVKVPVPAPIPEVKKSEPLLRPRSSEGLKPAFDHGSLMMRPDNQLRFSHYGVEIEFPPPKITPRVVTEWVEDLCDYFAERGLWLTNSFLASFAMSVKTLTLYRKLTKPQQDVIMIVLSRVRHGRKEPEEWSDTFRTQKIFDSYDQEYREMAKQKQAEKEVSTPKSSSKGEKMKTKPTRTSNGSGETHDRSEKKIVNVGGKKTTIGADVGHTEGGGKRFRILGLPMAAVLRWMGSQGWTRGDARKVLDAIGLTEVKDATISVKLYNGKGGGAGGEIPDLSKEQIAALNKLKGDSPPKKSTKASEPPKKINGSKGKKEEKTHSSSKKTNGKKTKMPEPPKKKRKKMKK